MISIEIFDPIPHKGRGKDHHTNDRVESEDDYIYLGAIIRDEKGNTLQDRKVTITATDIGQNKIVNSTGTWRKIIRNGIKKSVPYYPFNYEFKTAGKHVITFECEGVTGSVELLVKNKKEKIKDK